MSCSNSRNYNNIIISVVIIIIISSSSSSSNSVFIVIIMDDGRGCGSGSGRGMFLYGAESSPCYSKRLSFTSGRPVHSNVSGKHVKSKCKPWCFIFICIQLCFYSLFLINSAYSGIA